MTNGGWAAAMSQRGRATQTAGRIVSRDAAFMMSCRKLDEEEPPTPMMSWGACELRRAARGRPPRHSYTEDRYNASTVIPRTHAAHRTPARVACGACMHAWTRK